MEGLGGSVCIQRPFRDMLLMSHISDFRLPRVIILELCSELVPVLKKKELCINSAGAAGADGM